MKKLIIITGASSGIGAATAELFHKQGYPLLLLARRGSSIRSKNVLCKKMDISDMSVFQKAIKEAEEKFGPTDCLITSAAVLYLDYFHQQKASEWQETFQTNLFGVANGMHLVLPGMIQRKRGTIINLLSAASYGAFPTQAAYCATKFAVRALTDAIRKEVSHHNIRLMGIVPGAVETEVAHKTRSKKLKASFDKMREEVHPLDPHIIAASILYAYEQPQHITFREMTITPTFTVKGE